MQELCSKKINTLLEELDLSLTAEKKEQGRGISH